MSIQDIADLGWVPGAPAAPPPLSPAAQSDLANLSPQTQAALAGAPQPALALPYRPIGAPRPGEVVRQAPQPGNAGGPLDHAAYLTNGGPSGKAGAPADAPLPPVAPGRLVPGGFQPSTRGTEVGKEGGLDTTGGLADAQQTAEVTQDELARAQGAVTQEAPLRAKERAQEEAIKANELANIAAKQQQDYANELGGEKFRTEQAHAAHQAAIAKGVDPSHWFHEKSTVGKFAVAASLMASGFAGGMHGGGNAMLDFVQKQIDNDVRGQEQHIGQLGDVAKEADSHLAMFMREGLDKQQALAQSRMTQWQEFQKQLDVKAQGAPSMVKLALVQQQAAVADKIAKERLEYEKATQAKVSEKLTSADKYKPASVVGGGGASHEDYVKYAKKREDEGKGVDSEADWRRKTGGGGGAASDVKAGSDKVSPRLGVRLAAVNDAGSALDALEKVNAGPWGPGAKGQAHGAGAQAAARTAMLEAGVPPGEVDRVLPPGDNPSDRDLLGGRAALIQEAKALVERQKRTIGSAVEMSKGGGGDGTDTAGP